MTRISYLLILLFFCSPAKAQYQEGLDPSFGSNGVVATGGYAIYDDWGLNNGLLQPDGKILSIAYKKIIRYRNNGNIDSSFGTNGFFSDDLYDEKGNLLKDYIFYAPALQTDGKLLIAGIKDLVDGNVLLFRLKSDGTLDTTFGKKGVVCNEDRGNVQAYGIVLQPDGKIIVSGRNYPDSYQSLIRYHKNGLVDSSFGINGWVINDQVAMLSYADIELLPDGRIVALGDEFKAARYLPDGRLDTSFNHTGIASVFPGGSAPYSTAMVLQPDGKVWIAGYPLSDPVPFILSRIDSSGAADTSFMHTGYTDYAWDTGSENKCRDLLLQPDGKLVLGGSVTNKATGLKNFALLRIRPEGTIDSSFANYGRLLTQVNGTVDAGGADLKKLLLQSDGKLIGLGGSGKTTLPPSTLATMVRYNANGKTAISENPEMENGGIIYPNPAQSVINIRAGHNQAKKAIVYDLQGNVVRQFDHPQQAMDISGLANGLYLIRVTGDNMRYHQKLLILR